MWVSLTIALAHVAALGDMCEWAGRLLQDELLLLYPILGRGQINNSL